jgi:hypothetical protein
MLTSMLALMFAAATQLVLQIPSTNWDNQSVLFAEVVNATQLSAAGWSIRLSPLAVLTGNFDPAFTGRIDAGVWIGDLAGAITEAPKNGTKVIVVVQHAVLNQKDVYSIPNGSATFFPEIERQDTIPPIKVRPCLVVVSGFDDSKVTETIENLRKLRGKQREEAEQKAAAEKKGK